MCLQMNLSVKQTDLQILRTDFWLSRGTGWFGSLGSADANYYNIEWINSKVLLYSTENYIQYPGINHNGKEYEKEFYIYLNHFAVQQKTNPTF